MANDMNTAASELNKLKKSELIDIILTGNIPDQVSLNEEIRKIISVKSTSKETIEVETSENEVSGCDNKVCLALSKYKNEQIVMLQQIVSVQEKRAIDQELIISLLNISENRTKPNLQESVKYVNVDKEKRTDIKQKLKENRSALYSRAVAQTNAAAVSVKEIPTSIEDQQGEINNENIRKTENNEWKIQKKRKKPIYGTATETQIKGSMKNMDFHVYRIQPDTEEEDLTKYLKLQGIATVKCCKMVSKHPEEYASFKVSVPQDYTEKIQDPSIWPQYTCINRFLGHLAKKKQDTQM